MSGISPSSVTKRGHNENVNTSVLIKIGKALECGLSDIFELVLEDTAD